VARGLWLAAAAAAAARGGGWDAVLCDQVAQAVPLARRWCRAPVIFYCHFPDRLLAPAGGRFYGWYRGPLDRLEAAGMACADRVLVNSRFTAAAFRGAFPHAAAPAVVYPGVAIARCDPALATETPGGGVGGPATILSLARFAPAKGVELALDALAELRTAAPAAFAGCRLVLAGSCDERVREQRETRAALAARCTALGLDGRVELRPSVDEAERRELLAGCRFLVYTPAAEHFGMVPIEAMAAGRPVVAIAGGGPAETVVDGETGYLCPPAPAALAAAFARLLDRPDLAARLGVAGRRHVERHFSRAAFGAGIEAALQQAVRGRVQR
jgi:alpha-1,3/alpha-1,6-mannosyltransferase